MLLAAFCVKPWCSISCSLHARCGDSVISKRRLRSTDSLAHELPVALPGRKTVPLHPHSGGARKEPAGALRESHRARR